jgi:hypothetical protein
MSYRRLGLNTSLRASLGLHRALKYAECLKGILSLGTVGVADFSRRDNLMSYRRLGLNTSLRASPRRLKENSRAATTAAGTSMRLG